MKEMSQVATQPHPSTTGMQVAGPTLQGKIHNKNHSIAMSARVIRDFHSFWEETK